ncbi:MAG: hypothetical protein ACFFG0_41420 [Candidatus Thorarchaeota archaeon]
MKGEPSVARTLEEIQRNSQYIPRYESTLVIKCIILSRSYVKDE